MTSLGEILSVYCTTLISKGGTLGLSYLALSKAAPIKYHMSVADIRIEVHSSTGLTLGLWGKGV